MTAMLAMMGMMGMMAGAGALAACAGTLFLRRRAAGWGLLDVPNERSLHARAMPRGGGLAIVAVTALGLLASAAMGVVAPQAAGALVLALAMVAGVGWIDDRRSLGAAPRILVHVAAAAALVAALGPVDRIALPGLGELTLPVAIAVLLTVVWIVGLCNAYNFMDGIDGLAAGQAVVAGFSWALVAGSGAPLAGVAGVLAGGASLGFLCHNWAPARIFMGDVGSGFLGTLFAALPLAAFHATGDARLPAAGVLLVAPFVFDTSLTLLRRAARGENVVRAHRTHLYQRLVTAGWPHGRVAAVYVGLAAACGAAAFAWIAHGETRPILVPLAALALLPLLVARVERRGGA